MNDVDVAPLTGAARLLYYSLIALFFAIFMGAGVMHFVDPSPFEKIVPPFLPAKLALVYVSGAFEVLGALGLLWSKSRRYAAFGLVALLVAVFPANIYMAWAEVQIDPAAPMPVWAMWARLPMQFLAIAGAVFVGRHSSTS